MAKSVNSVVGIDIGTHTMKVAELRYSKDKPILTGVGIAPTPIGAVDHAGIHDPIGLGAALKRLLTESGISSKSVVFGITGQSSVVVRIIEVPKMNPSDLKEHMNWEIQRNIPFADTAIVSDFRPLNRPTAAPDSDTAEVVLAVAPQDAVDRIIATAKAAGVTPLAIDVEPLAIGRALIAGSPELYGDKTICVVNVGALSSTIDVYENGLLAFPRILPIGGESITQSIERAYGVTADEAERLKREKAEVVLTANPYTPPPVGPSVATTTQGYQSYGGAGEPVFEIEDEPTSNYRETYEDPAIVPNVLPGYEDYTVSETAAPAVPEPVQMPEIDQERLNMFHAISRDLEELVAEVRRSIEYYRSRDADADIDQILLCGGTSQIRNLDEYLHLSLGIPVAVADPLRGVNVTTKRYSESFLVENALVLPVCIGLATHAWYD